MRFALLLSEIYLRRNHQSKTKKGHFRIETNWKKG